MVVGEHPHLALWPGGGVFACPGLELGRIVRELLARDHDDPATQDRFNGFSNLLSVPAFEGECLQAGVLPPDDSAVRVLVVHVADDGAVLGDYHCADGSSVIAFDSALVDCQCPPLQGC